MDRARLLSSFFPLPSAFLLENRSLRFAGIAAGTLFAGLQVFQGQWGIFDRLVPSIHISDAYDMSPAVRAWTARKFSEARRLGVVLSDSSQAQELTEHHDSAARILKYEPYDYRSWFVWNGIWILVERMENEGHWPLVEARGSFTFRTLH